MKQLLSLLFVSLSFWACQNNRNDYNPSTYLNNTEQDTFKYEIVRFADRLAKRAKEDNKFDPKFDEEYQRKASVMKLDKYYVHESDGYIYFQVSRLAPSIHEKYVATGGRFKKNSEEQITEYEEIYRTWKMEKSELDKKTDLFFDYMVKGKDLSPYYTANIGDTEHIEFPDHQTFFNRELRRWEMRDTTYSHE